jgi:Na+-translocating ferredoxin:NAD+ oxidoreductase RnfC subunit
MKTDSIKKIRDAGVVGAGGAGFPTHVKLDAKVDTIIVNGAECEPLIHVDRQLLENNLSEMYQGLKTAAGTTGAKRLVIALKHKNKEALKTLESFQKEHNDFEIFKLDNFYPAGDEQVLVNEVTKKIVPEGGIPLNVGIVVINVETLVNVFKALQSRSVIYKYVTVNGEVLSPATFKVPVGTPVSTLIKACGGTLSERVRAIDGGAMTGKLVDINTHAVTKTTKAILVLPEDNIVVVQKKRAISAQMKRAQAICLSCRMCTDLCPRYLLGHDLFPDELMKKMYKKEIMPEDLANFDYAYLCCDCGLCELYSCVVDLSARSIFNYLKVELEKAGIKNPHTRSELKTNVFRDFRKIPVTRLVKRLEIDKYESRAALADFDAASVKEVKLYLTQHVGVPAVPVVREGDTVDKGAVIADIPEGKLGAKLHASVRGKIKQVTDEYIIISAQ